MSDNYIVLIPDDPDYVPSPEDQQTALALLREIARNADEVVAESTDRIQFIDCGGNFESVSCPNCGAEMQVEWWQDRMSEDYDGGFSLARFALPCCGSRHTLHELRYKFLQGFARFQLVARNPDISPLSESQLTEFAAVLHCNVRQILRHL